MPRLSWQKSWRFLAQQGGLLPEEWPNGPGELNIPVPDDKAPVPRLRDARFDEVDFENLTLPRTLIERCRFHGVSLRNTDLRESCLVGDFIDCDFSDVVLTCAQLGGANFFACKFANAILIGAELRGATLEHCDFTDANLTGARMDRALKGTLTLSDYQRQAMVDWRADDDEGPDDPKQDD
jgi:uncharacterized protein YjbI with pentapeptide repeats